MRIKESGENYLKAVLLLKKRNGTVYSVDVAAELGVSKSSVSVAMRNLRKGGYIIMGEDCEIILTAAGQEIAESVYECNLFFSEFLSSLGVDKKTATEDACRIEHALSKESYNAVKEYLRGSGTD